MAENWLDLCSGGVPVSTWFRITLDELKEIAGKAPDDKGVNRQLELCLVGLVSYFEAFCKGLFGFSINVYPSLLSRLRGCEDHDIEIDPLLAIDLGEKLRDRIGFVLAERF